MTSGPQLGTRTRTRTLHAQRDGRLQVSASGEEALENDPMGFWDDL